MWLVAEEAAYEADMDLLLERLSITELFHESLFTKLQKRRKCMINISWFYLVMFIYCQRDGGFFV